MTMAESILRGKSKEFAKQIVFLCRDIKKYERVGFNKSALAFGNVYRRKHSRGTICSRNKGFYLQIGDSAKRVLRNGVLDGIAL